MVAADGLLLFMSSSDVLGTTRIIVPDCKPLLKGETMNYLHTINAGILFIARTSAYLCGYNIEIIPVCTSRL